MRSRKTVFFSPVSSELMGLGREMCMPITSPVPKGCMNGFGRDKWTFWPVTSRKP